jgi:hypothetical protein
VRFNCVHILAPVNPVPPVGLLAPNLLLQPSWIGNNRQPAAVGFSVVRPTCKFCADLLQCSVHQRITRKLAWRGRYPFGQHAVHCIRLTHPPWKQLHKYQLFMEVVARQADTGRVPDIHQGPSVRAGFFGMQPL